MCGGCFWPPSNSDLSIFPAWEVLSCCALNSLLGWDLSVCQHPVIALQRWEEHGGSHCSCAWFPPEVQCRCTRLQCGMAQPCCCSEAERGFLERIGDISQGLWRTGGFRSDVLPCWKRRRVLAGTEIWGPSFEKGQSWMRQKPHRRGQQSSPNPHRVQQHQPQELL